MKDINQKLELMTIQEASDFLNLRESKMRSLVFKRLIPVIRIGRNLRFDKSDLAGWVDSIKQAQASNINHRT